MTRERLGVLPHQVTHVTERHDQRRVRDDTATAINDLGEARHRLQVILAAGSVGGALDEATPIRVCHTLDRGIDFELRVPRLERGHGGELRHRRAVALGGQTGDFALLLRFEAAVARCHHHARNETLDIPAERSGQRLVEVVEVEHQRPLRRAVQPEVEEVRITAHLDGEVAVHGLRQVVRHQPCRAAVERECAAQHAAVPDRHEPRQSIRIGGDRECDGIALSRHGGQLGKPLQRQRRTYRLAPLAAFCPCRMLGPLRVVNIRHDASLVAFCAAGPATRVPGMAVNPTHSIRLTYCVP